MNNQPDVLTGASSPSPPSYCLPLIWRSLSFLLEHVQLTSAIVKSRLPDAPETQGHLGDLFIMDFDKNGTYVQIALRPPPSREEVPIKIPIDPPLRGSYDVRPRMMQWRAIVRQKYEIVRCVELSLHRARGGRGGGGRGERREGWRGGRREGRRS